jgi:hypothetical protein
MGAHGRLREDLVAELNAAYAGGLISDQTLVARLDQVLGRTLVDPARVIGDLWLREDAHGLRGWLSHVISTAGERLGELRDERAARERLLALDWDAAPQDLIIGRSHRCDVVLTSSSVSRRHARLSSRDGCWILRDLDSTNGSYLNGRRVGRCELRPGDRLVLGDAYLRVD